MRGRKTNDTRKVQEQFTDNCRYLGLKLLADEYPQMIDRANENTPGYYEFIRDIVQAEAAVKGQRHIENLVKSSRMPYPLKMLADDPVGAFFFIKTKPFAQESYLFS